ncbi:Problable inactive peptidyl-prolyl cis-trans isomerase-like 6 [Holothuria leucospilota]|uniref:Peptidyl-prolyl cis-trans isomerase n=1 Tax=Holothuria leucospilota TaxID=206669 RepID=A0A9Q0YQQ2_HOLLE|nr:Problable inactive peptidyl-prolyl cis-trans isomerase-like 6 [Holothuria leucospilota]
MASRTQILVVGLLTDPTFHMAKCCAQGLAMTDEKKFCEPQIQGLLEFDWDMFCEQQKKALRGETWAFDDKAIVFVNGELLGGPKEFSKWASDTYVEYKPEALYLAMAKEAYQEHLESTGNTFVFFDISVGSENIGRLLLQLYTDKCPKTCENFRSLCTGERGIKKDEHLMTYHYKDTLLHRMVPNGWIQGGDILYGKGDGGESVYGAVFEDENFCVPHDQRGILGMANKGRHTNGSQFYITFQPAPWMDTKYVAFGRVVEGTNVLKILESQETYNERPKADCKIIDCGVFVP